MKLISKANMLHARMNHSLTAVGDQYLVSVGGYDIEDNAHYACEMYKIRKDEWIELPSLNVSRTDHAACVVGDRMLYVFCGLNKLGRPTNEIESLHITSGSNWHLLEISQDFPPRYDCGAVAIDNTNVICFGGSNQQGERLADVYLISTREKTIFFSNANTGAAISLIAQPLCFDAKNFRINVGNDKDQMLYSMQLDPRGRPSAWMQVAGYKTYL